MRVFQGTRLPNGSFIISPASTGQPKPLHWISADGALLTSFGDSVSPPERVLPGRLISGTRAGEFVTVRPTLGFEITEWHAPGEPARHVTLVESVFRRFEQHIPTSPQDPPQPHITGIQVDSIGRLWLAGVVADSQWYEGLGAARQVEGVTYYERSAPGKVTDAVIEVFDSTGNRLALWRSDSPIAQWVGPAEAGIVEIDDEGFRRVTIGRVELAGATCNARN